ncbi:MAG: hypothetical protein P1Q69_03560 [Candidatus Thorarchaeota archaeon]|nr:hypothetical protein [Candidatus Thorarchaeota archaeon]
MKSNDSGISRLVPFLAFVLIMASMQMPVQAHTPNSMTLSYDIGTQTLLVTVSHSVSDDHRIAQIQVWKNNELVNTRNYDAPQETTSGMDDTFMVGANSGDVLKVRATCSVSGFIEKEITVGVDPTDTTTDTTTDTSTTPESLPPTYLYLGGVIVVGIILVIVVILKKMR